jgi:hypothetical protein
MVDGLLCADLLYFTCVEGMPIVVISDDDDMVPALILAGERMSGGHSMHLLRGNKSIGSGTNDHLFQASRVILATY